MAARSAASVPLRVNRGLEKLALNEDRGQVQPGSHRRHDEVRGGNLIEKESKQG
jgi:hypothetical protein